MSGISNVQGSEPPGRYTKEELQRYQSDYQKGLELFQQSFSEYNKPNVEDHKKNQLIKVMDEALNVMNETASVALKKDKQNAEEKLNADYADFKNNPTPENQKKVSDDLRELQGS